MFAWITANAVLLVTILSSVVAVDHVLAASHLFAANSTGQAVLTWINTASSWVLQFVNPTPPAPPAGPSAPAAPSSTSTS